ncbi:sodium-dependent transporter [Psychrosphaera sp. 1_MG-2023]|uniref:sodium-dependent transporter n=1 Tax=Psychrosphaera sp. 1_MG-2023 TaxID=3062643 RepID=UPI0026E28ADC|nr:sodium-dependent transporter [Psychrosphaera sp. 1_MG-2023]MDO6720120.1 sodium-dependent transporter [Psychrosphaera sp. 1_MG-2023]
MSSVHVDHGQWSSRLAFILAATGSAVGLGNIWKFPYIMGENGGGAFVLVYLLCILGIGIPVMMAEVLIGRRGRQSPGNSVKALAIEAGANINWSIVGWLGVIAGFLILSFYSVIAGWAVSYIFEAGSGAFVDASPAEIESIFNNLLQDPIKLIIWTTFVLVLTGIIVGKGLKMGLEKAVSIAMPAMLVLLLIIAGYAAFNGDFTRTIDFMFTPDFSKLTYSGVLIALGHAFFTLSLASGAMMIYGAYLPQKTSIAQSVVAIAIADTLIALIAGLAIYPIVFGNGLEASQGPGLVFVSLPIAFGQMWGGTVFGTLFFIMLGFAAFTSAIAMVESAVAWLVEKMEYSRAKAAAFAVITLWLFSMLTVFSFTGAEWAKLDFNFVGKHVTNYFDLIDHLTADVLLPLGGLATAIFVAWIMKKEAVFEEMNMSAKLFSVWFITLKWFTPIAVLFVFLNLIGIVKIGQ